MSKDENELADRFRGMGLADVAEALHEIADRLSEQGLRAGRRASRVDPRGGYSAESDASSTTSSNGRHYHRNPLTPQIPRSRRQDQSDYSSDTDHHGERSIQRDPNTVPHSRYARSDTQRRVDSHHQNPQDQVDSHQLDPHSRSHQLDPRVGAHQLDPRVGAHQLDPHVGAHRSEPHRGSHRLEPRVDLFRSEPAAGSNRMGPRIGSNRMGPRVVTRRFHDIGRDIGRGSLSDHSPPPSPTPLAWTLPPQPPTPPAQGLNAPTVTRSHSLPQPQTREPVIEVADHSDIGDVFDLDASYVQLRDAGCVKTIHTPPRGEHGPKGRWYIVCVGREVGIFNDWAEVAASTDKVSGNSHQSTSSEVAAYTAFKRALLRGKVWVAK